MTESGQVPFYVDENADCPSHILVSVLLLDTYPPSPSLSVSVSLPLSVSFSNLSLSLSLFCLIPSLPFSHPLPFTVPFSVPFYVPFFHFVPPSLLQPLLPSVNKSDVTLSRKLLTVAASSPCSDSVTWCDKCDTVCCTKLTDESRLCL